MNRAAEISRLNRLSFEELRERAGAHLEVLDEIDAVHRRFARSIASRVATNNRRGAPTVLILPYGPVGQYPYLRDIVNADHVNITLSKGLGSRHWAAAAISKDTSAIAVTVSESNGTVRLFKKGEVILRVEPFRRAMKWKDFEYEPPSAGGD